MYTCLLNQEVRYIQQAIPGNSMPQGGQPIPSQGGRLTPYSKVVGLLKVLLPPGLRVMHNSFREGPEDESTKYASLKPLQSLKGI